MDHGQGVVHDRPQHDSLRPDGQPAAGAACDRRRRRNGSVRDHLFCNEYVRADMAQLRPHQCVIAGDSGVDGRQKVCPAYDMGRYVAHDLAQRPLLTDSFMAVVIGGLFTGCFLGICFLNNGSTGGTDIVAMIVNKYHHLPIGRVLLMADMTIISSAFFLPTIQAAGLQGAIEKILFGLTYTFMCSTAVDWVMNRMRQSVQFMIFSTKADEIAEAIITQAHRGCTFLEAEGGFNKKPMKVVTTIARSYESATIFRLVRSIDPNAFVSQSQVRGVFGQGFDPMANGK